MTGLNDPQQRHPGEHTGEIDWQALWRQVRRGRWLIAGVMGVCVAAAVGLTLLQSPAFRGEAVLQVEDAETGLNLSAMIPGLGDMAGLPSGSRLQTHMAVLRSRRIAEAVVDSLSLQVLAYDPTGEHRDVARVLSTPRDLRPAVFDLTRRAEGGYAVAQRDGPALRVPATVRPGVPFSLGEAQLVVAPGTTAERLRIVLRPFRKAVEEFQRNLTVLRPDPAAKVLVVQYQTSSPELAASVPNRVAQSFISYVTGVSQAESRTRAGYMREQAEKYKQELRDAEARLQSFREQAQIVEPKTQAEAQVRQIADMQARRDEMVRERNSLRQVLAAAEAGVSRPDEPSPFRLLGSYPAFVMNTGVQATVQTLSELETQRSQRLVLRTERDADVVALTRRIRDLEGQLRRYAQDYLQGLDAQITAADADLARVDGEVRSVPAREVQLMRLVREQQLLERVYALLETKLKEEEIGSAASPVQVEVIDPALVPERPFSPRPLLNLGIGLLLGLVGGLGVVFGRAWARPRVRSKGDVLAFAPAVPVLAAIPDLPRRGRKQVLPADALVTCTSTRHPVAEAYRTLAATLTRPQGGPLPRTVLVTSPVSGPDGVVLAANLAAALSQHGARTLLVDADLRMGDLGALFGVDAGPGFGDVLARHAGLQDAVVSVAHGACAGNLYLLPAGTRHGNPASLLRPALLEELVEEARGIFDVVVISAPPVNAVADATMVADAAEATVLVVRADETTRGEFVEAVDRLRASGTPLAGVVLAGSGTAVRYGEGQPPAGGTLGRPRPPRASLPKGGAPGGRGEITSLGSGAGRGGD